MEGPFLFDAGSTVFDVRFDVFYVFAVDSIQWRKDSEKQRIEVLLVTQKGVSYDELILSVLHLIERIFGEDQRAEILGVVELQYFEKWC